MPFQAILDMIVEQIRADGDADGAAHCAGSSYGAHGDGTVLLGDDKVDGHDEGADAEAETEAHDDLVAVLRGWEIMVGG